MGKKAPAEILNRSTNQGATYLFFFDESVWATEPNAKQKIQMVEMIIFFIEPGLKCALSLGFTVVIEGRNSEEIKFNLY